MCRAIHTINHKTATPFVLTVVFLLVLAADASADLYWQGFRGKDGAAVGAGDTPPVEISPEKNVKWKVDCPAGVSSPCVWADKIFLTAFDQGKLWTLCYAKADGKQLWKVEAPARTIESFHKTEGSPAASTPVTDGTQLVVYFGSCGLICYDYDGNEKWRREMPCAKTNFDFGTGTSPILYNDRVILLRDTATESSISAYATVSGKKLWSTSREGLGTSFGSPCVWLNGGTYEVVAPGAFRLKGYDYLTGQERWTVRNLPAAVCTSPIVFGTGLYFAGWSPGGEDFPLPTISDLLAEAEKAGNENGDGKLSQAEAAGTMLKGFFENNDLDHDGFITEAEWNTSSENLKKGRNVAVSIKPGGTGDITESHIAWQQTKGLPYVPSPLIFGGKMYFIKDGGLLTCLNLEDGKPVYQQARVAAPGSYYASPVMAADKIYLCGLEGDVTVVAAGDKPDVVSKTKFNERIFATPAIADHTLYLRTATKLYAFREAGK